jgi:transitional endoplasmic reticulum ATPase
VVRESELFTPADIEFAARHTTQTVFERVVLSKGSRMVTTDDVVRGISETRPTLTPQMVEEFTQDIVNYARI